MNTGSNVGRGVGGGWRVQIARATLAVLCLGASRGVQAGWVDFAPAQVIVGDSRLPDPDTLLFPSDVVLDPATGKVFVVDSGYHRILRFPSAAALSDGQSAEAVLGQPDLYTAVPGTTQTTLSSPWSAAIDASGRLWVSDNGNNRVLRWDQAATAASGAPAAQVLGQVGFVTRAGDGGKQGLSQPGGIAIDAQGRLWVVDARGSRVMRFDNPSAKPNGGTADGVLGQPDFNTYATGTSQTQFGEVSDLAADPQGRLWVVDAGNARVLRLDQPASGNFLPANGVLGQLDFTSQLRASGPDRFQYPTRVTVSPAGVVFVADAGNQRILRWDNAAARTNGAPANGVFGRTSIGADAGYPDSPAAGFYSVSGLEADSQGRLWAVDSAEARVLRWNQAAAKTNGAPATGVIGQMSPSTVIRFDPARGVTGPRHGVEDPVTGRFFVADGGRVLRFASRAAAEKGDLPQAFLGKTWGGSSGSGAPSSVNLPSAWNLLLDPSGRLWVSDPEGNRVVAFDQAATAPTGAAMSRVLGQPNYNGSAEGRSSQAMRGPRGLAMDAAGNLYVADWGNHRVLRFNAAANKAPGAAADAVLGQPDFTSALTDANPALLKNPSGVCVDAAGKLWVADTGRNRVLRYDAPLQAAPLQAASLRLGGVGSLSATGMSQPMAVAVTSRGRLWVLDHGFNRLLRFENADGLTDQAPASGVLGAESLVTFISGGRTLEQFWRPFSIFLDVSESIWVGDYGNHRLLRFRPESAATVTESGQVGGLYRIKFSLSRKGRFEVQSSTDLRSWVLEKNYDLSGGMEQVFEKPITGEARFFRVFEP